MLKATPSSDVQALSTGSATRAAPTLITEGMDLRELRAYVVTVSADSGHLLTGAGNMLCYRWSDALARWTRNPDLDFPITPSGGATFSGRDRACAEFSIQDYFGRMLWAPNAVAADGGTNVTTTIEGVREA